MDAKAREHVHVVLNPTSGAGLGGRIGDEIERELKARGLSVVVERTRGAGHATDLAEAAAAGGAAVVVAAGGDGTVHEVANGLLRSGGAATAALGLIPIGTGNDFVKVIPGTQTRLLAYDTLAHADVLPVDAGIVRWEGGEEYFVNAMGTGVDVEVVRQIERARNLPPALVYVVGLVRALTRYVAIPVRVDVGGETIERRIMMLAVANGSTIGGSFRICPDAMPADGLLDVCVVDDMSPLRKAVVARRILRGEHVGQAEVVMRRSKRVEIGVDGTTPFFFQVDGELREAKGDRLTVEVLPGALRVVAGGPAAGSGV
jgi:YegS/Rv2252/BmrU family lipid kinase